VTKAVISFSLRNKIIKPLNWITLLVVFFNTTLSAQQYYFKSVGVENGLPTNSVYSIFQDSRGYLWTGTEGGGLSKYNGSKIISYNRRDGLPGNTVRSLAEDSRGNLIIGTNNGLCYFNGNKFIHLLKDTIGNNIIVPSIYTDHKKKQIWIGTSGAGIFLLKEIVNGFQLIKQLNTANGFSSDFIFDMEGDGKGKIWVGTFGAGIHVLSSAGEIIKSFTDELSENRITCLTYDSVKSEIWAGTYGKGYFNINTLDFSIKMDQGKDLREEIIWDIFVDKKQIVIATDKNGAIVFSDEEKVSLTPDKGFNSIQVLKILKDHENGLWFGTVGAGLIRYSGSHFNYLTQANGLSNNNIFNIVEDHKNNRFFAGTWGEGINAISYVNNVPVISKLNLPLPDQFINDLALGSDNKLWFATKNGGAGYILNNQVKVFNTETGLLTNTVNCVLPAKDNTIWFGTSDGITLLKNNEFLHLSTDNGLANNEVQSVYEDKSGNIWIATLGGISKYDGSTLTNYNEEDGLFDKQIYSITEDKNGNIWLGTFGGGIYKFTKGNKIKIIQIANDSTLVSNNIYSLVFHGSNNIVVGTDKGFNYLTLDESLNKIIKCDRYTKANGFSAMEINLNSILVDSSNRIWLGTTAGITIFDKAKEPKTLAKLPFHLSKIKLFFDEMRFDSTGNQFHLPGELKLDYNQNHLTFIYDAVSFSNPENVWYSYILEGVDKNWSPPLKTQEITFSGVAPGNYIFKVRVSNDGVNWQNNIQTIKLTITPPFWKTVWFLASITFLGALMIVLFFKIRERNLKQKNLKLEEIVQERTKEVVEQKNEIEKYNEELHKQNIKIAQQKDLVEYQKKEITDSINYAKGIQTAILPEILSLTNLLPDSFILFIPKDIVSGDFYFFKGDQDQVYIAAADCTGHGVPGGFMSMLGFDKLDFAVSQNKSVSEVLTQLNKGIKATLKQHTESSSRDGMDIALCRIDQNKKLFYSGANRPLWLIKNGTENLIEIKATKVSIGGHTPDDQQFEQIEIDIEKGDRFYISSDGFADQFGGTKGKKLMTKNFKEIILSIQHLSMKDQHSYLDNFINEWKSGIEQNDDILVIGGKI